MADGTMIPKDAARLLEADRQERVRACEARVEEALREYRCRLDVVVVLRAGSVEPQVHIVAVD